jgi:FAD/FMN-containing dehydrogenase
MMLRNASDAKKRLGSALVAELGRKAVSRQPSVVQRHSFDALRPYRGFLLPESGFPPDFVVTPASSEDVMRVMKIARKFDCPIIPWGAGTGLMGGAIAVRGGIVLDFRRMNRILGSSVDDLSVRVQPGATLSRVNMSLRKKGLFLGHDPWTRDYATVGGAISTNGLGYYGGKYGSMGDQVLGLQVVLSDGKVMETAATPTSSTLFDIKRLFIGTEGSMGIITEATLRCFPIPEKESVFAYSFHDFKSCFKAILKMRGLGLIPASLESAMEEGRCRCYVVFAGARQEVRVVEARCRQLFSSSGGEVVGNGAARSYWKNRHMIADYYEQGISESPSASWREERSFDFIHVALPASRVLRFSGEAMRVARRHRISVEDYGIWIKPEFFSMTFTREEGVPEENLKLTVDETLKLGIRMGGSFEYCHGVGLRLGGLMRAQHGRGLIVMKRVKKALDPTKILNPSKFGLDD